MERGRKHHPCSSTIQSPLMIHNFITLKEVSNRKRGIAIISSPRLSFSWGRGFRIRGVCPWQGREQEQTNFFLNSKLGDFQQLLEPCGNNSSIPCRVFFFKIYFYLFGCTQSQLCHQGSSIFIAAGQILYLQHVNPQL